MFTNNPCKKIDLASTFLLLDFNRKTISFLNDELSNKLKGSWITNDADNKLLYAFAIDNGNFSAEASDGCSIDGDLNIPNGNLNVFQLTLVISGASCSYSGDYTGLGYLKDDKITFAYSNDNYGFVLEAEKFGL